MHDSSKAATTVLIVGATGYIGSAVVAEAVTQYADTHDVDLIALTTHGRTGIRHLVLGSVAESILRHSHVPVLCFPPSKEARE